MKNLIQIPKNCPSCGSILEFVGAELFCLNSIDCPAQNSKRVENFTSVMKIKGLGPKSIEKLYECFEYFDIVKLYELTMDELIDVLGEANGKKVWNEIQKSRSQSLENFIHAIGIPKVGASAAKIIAKQAKTLEGIFDCVDSSNDDFIKELGQVKFNSLVSFVDSGQLDKLLEIQLNLQEVTETNVADSTGLVACITGKLNNYKNRKEAEQYLHSLGIETKSSVTKVVTHLICEDASKQGSSSYKKALSMNIPICTMEQIESLITTI